jgi:hypothetical protein
MTGVPNTILRYLSVRCQHLSSLYTWAWFVGGKLAWVAGIIPVFILLFLSMRRHYVNMASSKYFYCNETNCPLCYDVSSVCLVKISKRMSFSHTAGSCCSVSRSLTFIKTNIHYNCSLHNYYNKYIITYTQSKTVLFSYSLLINIKGLGGWDTVKPRWATTKICSNNLHHPITRWFHQAPSSVWENIFRFFRASASGK